MKCYLPMPCRQRGSSLKLIVWIVLAPVDKQIMMGTSFLLVLFETHVQSRFVAQINVAAPSAHAAPSHSSLRASKVPK